MLLRRQTEKAETMQVGVPAPGPADLAVSCIAPPISKGKPCSGQKNTAKIDKVGGMSAWCFGTPIPAFVFSEAISGYSAYQVDVKSNFSVPQCWGIDYHEKKLSMPLRRTSDRACPVSFLNEPLTKFIVSDILIAR